MAKPTHDHQSETELALAEARQRADNLQIQLERLGLTTDERREMAGRFAEQERKKEGKKK